MFSMPNEGLMAAEPFDGICTLVDDLVLLGGVLFLDD